MGAAPATVSVRLEGHSSSVAQEETEDGVKRGSSTLLTMQEEPDDAAMNQLNHQDASFIKVESELHTHQRQQQLQQRD